MDEVGVDWVCKVVEVEGHNTDQSFMPTMPVIISKSGTVLNTNNTNEL